MSEYLIHFDGSCGPRNPGPNAGWGYTVHKDGKFHMEDSGQCEGNKGIFSNNFAEFRALYEALEYVVMNIKKSDKLFIRGDSQLVINIMNNKWKAKSGLYYDAYVLAYNTLKAIRKLGVSISIDWVPRKMNENADKLSNDYKQ
jgi:ribonuclease HI